MKFVMVTEWVYHWDKLGNRPTSYPFYLIKPASKIKYIKENTPTIFIKLDANTQKAKKAWEGRVYDFNTKQNKLNFKVIIKKEIKLQPKHHKYKSGWYITTESDQKKAKK